MKSNQVQKKIGKGEERERDREKRGEKIDVLLYPTNNTLVDKGVRVDSFEVARRGVEERDFAGSRIMNGMLRAQL